MMGLKRMCQGHCIGWYVSYIIMLRQHGTMVVQLETVYNMMHTNKENNDFTILKYINYQTLTTPTSRSKFASVLVYLL